MIGSRLHYSPSNSSADLPPPVAGYCINNGLTSLLLAVTARVLDLVWSRRPSSGNDQSFSRAATSSTGVVFKFSIEIPAVYPSLSLSKIPFAQRFLQFFTLFALIPASPPCLFLSFSHRFALLIHWLFGSPNFLTEQHPRRTKLLWALHLP
jgi:hypothetical protein